MKSSSYIIFALLLLFSGCLSPEKARKKADDDAYGIIKEAQVNIGASTGTAFSVERPADVLRRKLMIDQNLPSATNLTETSFTGTVVDLSVLDCLQIGARNNNTYQKTKEDIFRAALAVDLLRYSFGTSYSGVLSGSYQSDHSEDNTSEEISAGFETKVSRTLKNGAKLAGAISLDVVKLLTGDRDSAYGLLLDVSATIPLLRGAGRDVVLEPLTQAERDLFYALLHFERYRKSFTVQIAQEFMRILQAADSVLIAKDNLNRLERGFQRSKELSEAGRLPKTELDQTEQDVLRARTRLVSARQNEDALYDAFKSTLGLPVDARIKLDDSILKQLRLNTEEALNEDDSIDISQSVFIRRAFESRLDLRVVLYRLEDSERKIMVAAADLKAGAELTLSGSSRERRNRGSNESEIHFNDGTYAAGLNVDLPWEMRDERNRYREALMSAEDAKRAVEQKEDEIKAAVRSSIRRRIEAKETYRIQKTAVELAEHRVKSTEMFVESGRAKTRDVLEAQEALVNARSALTDAVVSYHVARWTLFRDIGELRAGSLER